MQRVLFVCAENAGRSQIAEHIFNRLVEERGIPWRAESAGTMPAAAIHDPVRQLLSREGYVVGDATPKKFDLKTAGEYARIISFGCLAKEALPPDIRSRIADWDIEDPRDADEKKLENIYATIHERVEALVDEIATVS